MLNKHFSLLVCDKSAGGSLHIMMKLHLFMCVLIEAKGEWIRIDHMSPVDMSLVRNDDLSSMISVYNNHSSSVQMKNESMTEQQNVSEDSIEERTAENSEPLVFSSLVKDTLLKTNWLLSQQEDNSLKGKLKFLQTIKQHLLHGIWEQSRTLWNRKTSEPRFNFGFPSIEGALITIAFLTFAVFLIKIVQQFIQGLQQGLAPNTAGFQIPNIQGARHKRETNHLLNEKAARILQYMDDFKMHYEL